MSTAKWGWLVIAMAIGVVGHYSRALRWKQLITPLGYQPTNANAFASVMIMYMANFAVPRLGEVSRCAIMKRYEGIPLNLSVGTMITERFVDLICLILITFLAIALEYELVREKIFNKIFADFSFDFSSLLILAAVGLGILVILFLMRNKIKQLSFYHKVKKFVLGLIEGGKSILKLEKPGLFLFHTFFIWFAYFVSFYLAFRCFGFTEHLGPKAGLAVLVFGSFGVVAPSPGGLGAFHWLVMVVLWAYGVGGDDFADIAQKEMRLAFANLMYFANLVTLASGGLIALLVLPIINKNRIPKERALESQ